MAYKAYRLSLLVNVWSRSRL